MYLRLVVFLLNEGAKSAPRKNKIIYKKIQNLREVLCKTLDR